MDTILLILLFVTGAASIVLVLLHSGKGTGLAPTVVAGMRGGVSVAERNLNKYTVIVLVAFVAVVFVMALVFPTVRIGG